MNITKPLMVLAGALITFSAGAAAADEVIKSPETIGACLCREHQVAAQGDAMKASQDQYNQRQKALADLNTEVDTARASLNVNDQNEVDAFKRLLTRRDQAHDDFVGQVSPGYAGAVAAYNQAVADFNTNCAGKAYAPDVAAKVKETLSCPKP